MQGSSSTVTQSQEQADVDGDVQSGMMPETPRQGDMTESGQLELAEEEEEDESRAKRRARRMKRKLQGKSASRSVEMETYVIVRPPPPMNAKRPLNLQIQLMIPKDYGEGEGLSRSSSLTAKSMTDTGSTRAGEERQRKRMDPSQRLSLPLNRNVSEEAPVIRRYSQMSFGSSSSPPLESPSRPSSSPSTSLHYSSHELPPAAGSDNIIVIAPSPSLAQSAAGLNDESDAQLAAEESGNKSSPGIWQNWMIPGVAIPYPVTSPWAGFGFGFFDGSAQSQAARGSVEDVSRQTSLEEVVKGEANKQVMPVRGRTISATSSRTSPEQTRTIPDGEFKRGRKRSSSLDKQVKTDLGSKESMTAMNGGHLSTTTGSKSGSRPSSIHTEQSHHSTGGSPSAQTTPGAATSTSATPILRSQTLRERSFSGSSFASGVSSFSTGSKASGSSTARRIVPLWNLSVHKMIQTTVTDAGTDVKVAKFAKRSIDVVDVASLEPMEYHSASSLRSSFALHSNPLSAQSTRNPLSAQTTRSQSGVIDTLGSDRLQFRPVGNTIKASLDLVRTTSESFFGGGGGGGGSPTVPGPAPVRNSVVTNVARRQSVSSPVPTTSPATKTSSLSTPLKVSSPGAGRDPKVPEPFAGTKKLFGKMFKRKGAPSALVGDGEDTEASSSPVLSMTSPTKSTFDTAPVDHLSSPALSTLSGVTGGNFAASFGVAATAVNNNSHEPALQYSHPTFGMAPALAPGTAVNGRARAYTFTIRKWAPAKAGPLGNAVGLAQRTSEQALGLDPSIVIPMNVTVEWRRGESASSKAKRKLSQTGASGTGTPSLRGRQSGQSLKLGGSPPKPSASVAMAIVTTAPRIAHVRESLASPNTTPRSSLEGVRPRLAALLQYPSSCSSSPAPSLRRAQSYISPGEEDEGEESDPEDSETPWLCTIKCPGHTVYHAMTHHPGKPGRLPRENKGISVATLYPAPHHPRIVGQIKLPRYLKSIPTGLARPGPSFDGLLALSETEEIVLTDENIKDIVGVTSMWLVVREEFGGLGKGKKKI